MSVPGGMSDEEQIAANSEAETVSAIVAWLREEASMYADSFNRFGIAAGSYGDAACSAAFRRLANDLERGDWRKVR